MNKYLITFTAIAIALMAGNAYAALDLQTGATVNRFAKEINVNTSTGTVLSDSGASGLFDVTTDFGFGANAGEERYVRFDLSNGAKFEVDPEYECNYTSGTSSHGTLSQGGAGNSFVIFNFIAGTDTQIIDDGTLTIDPAGIRVYNKSDVEITYGHYKFPYDAQNRENTLDTASGTLIEFDSALDWEVDAVNTEIIDVTIGSKNFESPTIDGTTVIGDINMSLQAGVLKDDGTAVVIGDLISGSELTVEGDFSACQNSSNGSYTGAALNRVFIDSNGTNCNTKSLSASSLSGSEALFNTGADLTHFADPSVICMEVNGVTPIAEGIYEGAYSAQPSGNKLTVDDIDFGELSELEKNGTTDRITFMVNKDSSYQTYIRITNPSNIDGNVFLTLTNDSGNTVTFGLGSVTDVTGAAIPDSLSAGASTALIPVSSLFTAAQSAAPGFNVVGNSRMLRLDVEAEFGGTGQGQGVVVNGVSANTDGTGFTMIE